MSKTRNLSDLLDANGDVKSTALDNVPASNDASALTTGTLDSARLGTITNFTSTGIDDNADANAITIDNSENVFVKTTGTGTSIGVDAVSTGFYLRNGGQFRVARDSSQSIIANRLNTDGVIIDCRKDGTTVGQLGGNGGDLYIASTTSGHKGFRFGNGAIVPTNTSGGTDDNATTLGGASQRFANLYLGGNIYLGGTGSANALDDYEEGSFTPQYRGSVGSAGSLAYSSQEGRYTKIGRLVFIQIRLILSNNGSFSSGGNIEIYGLPFTVANQAAPPPASLELRKVTISDHTAYASFNDGSTYLKIKVMSSGNNPDDVSHGSTVSDSGFLISGMYIT